MSNVSSVASVSSGCNVLYSFSKFFLSWKRSKNTLFFAVRFALTSCVYFVSSDTLLPRFLKTCGTRYDISCSRYTLIIQKNAYLYNKIRIKFLSPSVSLCSAFYPADFPRSEAYTSAPAFRGTPSDCPCTLYYIQKSVHWFSPNKRSPALNAYFTVACFKSCFVFYFKAPDE